MKIAKPIALILGIFLIVSIISRLFFSTTHVVKYKNQLEKYSKTNLNIRRGPSTDKAILKTIKPNDKIITYDTNVNGFTLVLKIDSTKYGWTSIKYLQSLPLSSLQLDAIKYKNDPLHIGRENVMNLVGTKVPFDKWSEWGSPKTKEGTDNKYWVVFLPKANISFVSLKKGDEIIFADLGENKAKNYLKNTNKKRTEKIETQFSSWDGSHKTVANYIKENMHDPDSYEHVKTIYWDMGDYLIVKTTIRGNNMFGGKVLNTYTAKVSIDGTLLEISE